jgi:hypothetical protein
MIFMKENGTLKKITYKDCKLPQQFPIKNR